MKIIKIILTIIILNFSLDIYSQAIRRYESDYSMKVTIDKDESADGGSVQDVMQVNTSIIYNITNSTIEVILTDQNKRIYFLKNVKYDQTFTNKGNKYVAYTADEDGVPY